MFGWRKEESIAEKILSVREQLNHLYEIIYATARNRSTTYYDNGWSYNVNSIVLSVYAEYIKSSTENTLLDKNTMDKIHYLLLVCEERIKRDTEIMIKEYGM